ncbi:MAG: hypothetical protein ABI382_10545 [Nakamurella sp.]
MDIETLKTVAMWALIAVAVVGILLAIVIKKIIGKVIALVLAAVLVFFCWQQREKVLDAGTDLKTNTCSTVNADLPSFFGIKISLPDDWCAKK